jgi:hypothetical protein
MTWQGLVVRSRWTGVDYVGPTCHPIYKKKIYISTKEKGKRDRVFFSGGSPLNRSNPPPPLSGEHRAPPPARQGATSLPAPPLRLRTSPCVAPRVGRWQDVVDGSRR